MRLGASAALHERMKRSVSAPGGTTFELTDFSAQTTRYTDELRDSLFLTANVHPIQVTVPREQAEEASAALERAREDSADRDETEDPEGD